MDDMVIRRDGFHEKLCNVTMIYAFISCFEKLSMNKTFTDNRPIFTDQPQILFSFYLSKPVKHNCKCVKQLQSVSACFLT